jgi:hypothetical protein
VTRRPRGRNLLLFAVALVVALLVGEAALRIAGYRPREDDRRAAREPVLFEPDPVLGWRPKPGTYVYPAYTSGRPDIHVTIWPDGSRATAEERVSGRPRVLFLGGSFTQGWAISDEETMLYKLQRMFPDVEFVNLGVGGYGTYQCLLRLEETLRSDPEPPVVVVYAFFIDHETRNVAVAEWLRILRRFGNRGHVATPYCRLAGDGTLRRMPAEAYPVWPGDDRSSLINLMKDSYAGFRFRGRAAEARPVTFRLVAEMRDLCASRGIPFLFLFLAGGDWQADYDRFLESEKILHADCSDPFFDLASSRVAGEGHPNGRMNSIWAACVAEAVRTRGEGSSR